MADFTLGRPVSLATSNSSNFDLVASAQAAQAAADAAPMGSNLGHAAETLKGEIAEFTRRIADQEARRLEEDRQVHPHIAPSC